MPAPLPGLPGLHVHSQAHRPSFPLLLSLHCRLVAAKVRLLIVSPMPSETASTAASPEDEGELNPWQRRVIARTAAQSKGAAGGPRRNTSGGDEAIANPVPAGLNTSDGADGVANPVPEDGSGCAQPRVGGRGVSTGSASACPAENVASSSCKESSAGSGEHKLLPSGRPAPPTPPRPRKQPSALSAKAAGQPSATSVQGEVKEGDLSTLEVEDRAALRSSSEGSGSGVLTQDAAENWLSKLDDKPECNAGHPLFRFGTPGPNWTCSSCLKEFRNRKLLWGCRVCDYDLCGSCLSGRSLRHGKESGHRGSPLQRSGRVRAGAGLQVELKSLAADEHPRELLPDALDATLKVNGEMLSVRAACPSDDFKGGFRKVYLIDGLANGHHLVLKVARSNADNICELKASLACPAVFTKVHDSGSIELQLRPNSVCNIFFLLSERVVRLKDMVGILPKSTAAWVAYRSIQSICTATEHGVKCRDLGVKQWGFRGLVDPCLEPQALLHDLVVGLRDDSVQLVILDANCCIPNTYNASLLGPRRMSSYWAMILTLTNASVVAQVQDFLRSQSFNAKRIAENLASSLYAA